MDMLKPNEKVVTSDGLPGTFVEKNNTGYVVRCDGDNKCRAQDKEPRLAPVVRPLNWVVHHQSDNDPTHVFEKKNDPVGNYPVVFPASMPAAMRVEAATSLARRLNSDQVPPNVKALI